MYLINLYKLQKFSCSLSVVGCLLNTVLRVSMELRVTAKIYRKLQTRINFRKANNYNITMKICLYDLDVNMEY